MRKNIKNTGGTILLILSLVVVVWLLSRGVVGLGIKSLPEKLVEGVAGFELPGFFVWTPDVATVALSIGMPGTLTLPVDKSTVNSPGEADANNAGAKPDGDTNESVGGTLPEQPSQDTEPTDQDTSQEPEPEQEPDVIGTTITGEGSTYEHLADGITIKNKTDYNLDVEGLLSEPLDFTFSDGSAQVLILHTHGSEAFTQAGKDVYTPSDPYRTTDENYNVVRVGDELATGLIEQGISVIHDRELYDYPSYNGSYSRAWKAISQYLDDNPNIRVIIDLHRDALMDSDGTVYKTVADIGSESCAQVMLIAGTNFSGLNHPDWRKNLSFALKLQAEMNTSYPTLARPLCISQYRYNQNATTGSLIAEVGTNGNTLQEALTAVRYFGDCLATVLLRT